MGGSNSRFLERRHRGYSEPCYLVPAREREGSAVYESHHEQGRNHVHRHSRRTTDNRRPTSSSRCRTRSHTKVRLFFVASVIHAMIDNSDDGGNCVDQAVTVELGFNHCVEHPELIPDLPWPPIASVGLNVQSYLCTSIAGTPQHFAVRAQASIQVSSIVRTICGIPLGPWGVSTKSTAYYYCTTGDTKSIRVDLFQSAPQ